MRHSLRPAGRAALAAASQSTAGPRARNFKKPSPSSRRPTHYESLPLYCGVPCGLLGAPTLPGAGRVSQRVLRLPISSASSSKVRVTRLGRGSDQGLWRA
jgi:hypothetical protein